MVLYPQVIYMSYNYDVEIQRPKSKQPIPENAKRVFSGILFDVYHWEQELYDGTRTIFEKLKRQDTVVIFGVLDNGNILLSEQEQPGKEPFIGGLGGRVEKDEDVLTAAKREFLEESGFEAERFILWRAEHPTSKIDWVIYTFVAKGLKKVSDLNLDGGEKIKIKEVSFDNFLEISKEHNFSEKEIVIELQEAVYDPKKKEELKKLFDPKN